MTWCAGDLHTCRVVALVQFLVAFGSRGRRVSCGQSRHEWLESLEQRICIDLVGNALVLSMLLFTGGVIGVL